MSCPDCGSQNAVDKATAWDASIAVPKKAQDELDAAHTLRQVARNVIQFGIVEPSAEHTCMFVRVDLLTELAHAAGLPGISKADT